MEKKIARTQRSSKSELLKARTGILARSAQKTWTLFNILASKVFEKMENYIST